MTQGMHGDPQRPSLCTLRARHPVRALHEVSRHTGIPVERRFGRLASALLIGALDELADEGANRHDLDLADLAARPVVQSGVKPTRANSPDGLRTPQR
jgi:hypothetical protein